MKPPINSTTKNHKTNSSNLLNNQSQTQDLTLLQYLFSLLMIKESRLQSCQLIESILLHIPMLNLNRINNIKFILETIDDDGLSCICKIFAVTLSNLDMNEKKYLAIGQRRIQQQNTTTLPTSQSSNSLNNSPQSSSQSSITSSTSSSNINTTINKKNTSNSLSSPNQTQPLNALSVRDQNQDLLLNIPTLLFRLVNLVRRKDYAVRFSGANSEIEHWIRYIDQTLSDSEDNDDANDLNFLSNGFSSLANNTSSSGNNESMDTNNSNSNSTNNVDLMMRNIYDNQLFQPALLAADKLNNFVYVLYTLSLLLIGKEKKNVQKSLTKLRLASALNSLFDYLIWNCRCEYPNSSSANTNNQTNNENNAQNNNNNNNNNPQMAPEAQQQQQQQQQQQLRSHMCPEVAVKIQFLRLVHSFCDHSE